jgi:hypothetical protein
MSDNGVCARHRHGVSRLISDNALLSPQVSGLSLIAGHEKVCPERLRIA